MAMLTVRNLPDEIHRALRARAVSHGQSMEAEVRAILESAVRPQGSVKLGSLLVEMGRQAKLSDEEWSGVLSQMAQLDPEAGWYEMRPGMDEAASLRHAMRSSGRCSTMLCKSSMA